MVVDWLITGRFVSIAADTCTQQLWELTESFSITAWLDAVYVARRLLVLGLQAVLALSRCLHHASASHMMTSVRVISAMLACSLSNVIATIHRIRARTGHMWVTFWCCKDHSNVIVIVHRECNNWYVLQFYTSIVSCDVTVMFGTGNHTALQCYVVTVCKWITVQVSRKQKYFP